MGFAPTYLVVRQMIIQLHHPMKIVTVDLELRTVRLFKYDEPNEWNRDHIKVKGSQDTGVITDGYLTEGECVTLTNLAHESIKEPIQEVPSDIHGFGMLQIWITDHNMCYKSKWNLESKMANSIIKLGKYMNGKFA